MGRFTQPDLRRDLRQNTRRPFRMSAWIDRRAALPRIACTFEDVSLDGARIHVAMNDCLPARFQLLLSQRLGSESPVRCAGQKVKSSA
jgi:hypothetical protein